MEQIVVSHRQFEIVKEVETNEVYSSYLVTYKSKKFLLRKYQNILGFDEARYRYKKLYSYGIHVPVIEYKDKKQLALVFEHFDEPTMLDVLSEKDIPEEYFEKLFTIYRYARVNQVDINYLPENFVVRGKKMYYTSLDLFEANKEINLENYGLDYWIISQKGYDHLKELGHKVDKKRLLSKGETNKKIVLLSLFNW